MEALSKTYVADVAFHNVTMGEAVNQIVAMARKTEKPRYVCTGNLDHLVTLARDEAFRDIYHGADLTLADGKPVVWLSHLAVRDVRHARRAGAHPRSRPRGPAGNSFGGIGRPQAGKMDRRE